MYKVSVLIDGKTVDSFDASSLSVVTIHRQALATHVFKRDPDPDARDTNVSLSAPQLRFLKLLAAGKTLQNISNEMGRVRGTGYRMGLRICERLHVSSMPAAIIKAKALGLID